MKPRQVRRELRERTIGQGKISLPRGVTEVRKSLPYVASFPIFAVSGRPAHWPHERHRTQVKV